MRRSSMDRSYFEELYAKHEDPWNFATSDYERRKYSETLAALPKKRYRRALEVGCSIGVLTYDLGARCESLLAIDPAQRALQQASSRCCALGNVSFALMEAPDDWPTGTFDLIVLSEVVYYLTRKLVTALAKRIRESLAPGGHVELVHWTGETDYPLSGDEATEAFFLDTASFLTVIHQVRTPSYRLALCERTPLCAPENI